MDKTGLRPVRRALAAFGAILFVFALGIAGTCYYEEQVVQEMGNEVYSLIKSRVGGDESAIVEEYMAHRNYYDSIR